MAFVQIPLSNSLRMVRTDNQGSNLPNFSNRLLHQEDYVQYNDIPYAQKISSSDTILIQFSTDYTTITAGLYDLDDNLVSDKTSDIVSVLVSTTFTVYNLSFDIGAKGSYYLKIDFGAATEVYESEWFQIDSFNADNVVKIEYNTSENDGIVYNNSETFVIRVEGRLIECTPGQNKEVYTSYSESMVNLNSYPTREFKLEYGAIPRYMLEKLNLALAHQVFKINDVEYQSKDAPDSELIRDGVEVTNMYTGDVKLQEVDYENYMSTADDEPLDTFHLLSDSNNNKLLVKNNEVEYFIRFKD